MPNYGYIYSGITKITAGSLGLYTLFNTAENVLYNTENTMKIISSLLFSLLFTVSLYSISKGLGDTLDSYEIK